MQVIAECVAVLFLGIFTAQDMRSRRLDLRLLVFFLVAGIVIAAGCNGTSVPSWGASLIPGITLLIIAGCSREAVGYGDGLVTLILGLVLGGERAVTVLLLALMLTVLCGGVQAIRHRGGRKMTLPFVPFLLMGDVICLIGSRMNESL